MALYEEVSGSADKLGADAGGSLVVNTEFGMSFRDATDLQTLVTSVNAGHVTKLTYLKELKRRGVLADSVSAEEEADASRDDVPLGLMGREHDDHEGYDHG